VEEMTDIEAEKAIKQKQLVVTSDSVGSVFTGHLVEKQKKGKNLVFLFENGQRERIVGPASRFSLCPFQI